LFEPDTRLKDRQKYCSKPQCQIYRKSKWERDRKHCDPNYRQRRKVSQEKWVKNKPLNKYQNYYRKTHPDYVKINREKQRLRNNNKKNKISITEKIVKMDSINYEHQENKAKCVLKMDLTKEIKKIVKMDSIIIELSVIKDNTWIKSVQRE
jgi:hypothetical protein